MNQTAKSITLNTIETGRLTGYGLIQQSLARKRFATRVARLPKARAD